MVNLNKDDKTLKILDYLFEQYQNAVLNCHKFKNDDNLLKFWSNVKMTYVLKWQIYLSNL